MARFLMNTLHQSQIRAVAKIDELAGQRALVGACLEALKIFQNRLGLGVRVGIRGFLSTTGQSCEHQIHYEPQFPGCFHALHAVMGKLGVVRAKLLGCETVSTGA